MPFKYIAKLPAPGTRRGVRYVYEGSLSQTGHAGAHAWSTDIRRLTGEARSLSLGPGRVLTAASVRGVRTYHLTLSSQRRFDRFGGRIAGAATGNVGIEEAFRRARANLERQAASRGILGKSSRHLKTNSQKMLASEVAGAAGSFGQPQIALSRLEKFGWPYQRLRASPEQGYVLADRWRRPSTFVLKRPT